jgi:NAD(P)H-hydrate epimerase
MSQLLLSREQVRRVDRRAIQDCGMSGLVLMENAGRGCTDQLCQLGVRGPVVLCCGRGNNAGDGFVIARHLEIRGHVARVLLWSDPARLEGDAAENFRLLELTDVHVDCMVGEDWPGRLESALSGADWAVDALLGTGARGEPRAPLDAVIDLINAAHVKRLAVDVPSGLDCDTGQPSRHTFRADHTCTFVAAKRGFAESQAAPYLGTVHVHDIGVPPAVVKSAAEERV